MAEPRRPLRPAWLDGRTLLAILGLAVTQMTGWGTTYYLPAVLGGRRLDEDGGGSRLELFAEGEPPALCDQAGVGQRYASACRFLSDGSFSRICRSRARSSSAEITVSSSAACARTIPHGSTMSERP